MTLIVTMDFDNPVFDDTIEGDERGGDNDEGTPGEAAGMLSSGETAGLLPDVETSEFSQSTETLRTAIDSFYDDLAGEGLVPSTERDYTKFGINSDGRIYLKDRPDLGIINRSTGHTLSLHTIERKPGGGIGAINELGFVGWTRRGGMPSETAEALQEAGQALGDQAAAMAGESLELQDLGAAASVASNAIQTMETTFTNTDLMGEDLPYPVREIRGLSKTLQTFRGELTNNLAKLSELNEQGHALDKDIAKEQQKLGETKGVDEGTRHRIAERLCKLEEERASVRDERASHLEATAAN